MGTTDERQGTRARMRGGLPLKGAFRLRRFGDIWHKNALSAVIALAIPDLVLLALGRLDLAVYTSAGAMCALYAHGLPYAARARTLLWVALGMIASVGVALTAAGLTRSTTVLIIVAAVLAALHKVACDAARIGPPGNVIFTFIAATCAFMPQRLSEVPFHLLLATTGAALAWLVCMAPGIVRPDGPQRIAVARALEAAARALEAAAGVPAEAPGSPAAVAGVPAAGESLVEAVGSSAAIAGGPAAGSPAADAAVSRARHDAAAAVNAAWHTLLLAPAGPGRGALERLLAHAEESLVTGSAADADRLAAWAADADRLAAWAADADRLAAWAGDLRRNRPLPETGLTEAEAAELTGIAVERAARRGRPRPLRAFHPASPLFPIGIRVAVGSALAGVISMAAGVGHPYWAIVTAASVFQANAVLSWHRALQRALGSFAGLLLFTALLPVSRTGQLALVLLVLLLQFVTEALITRNYWLGTVCVTPMALLLTEFPGYQPAGSLIADRWLDTCVGVAAGLLSCLLVTNRRTASRIDDALRRVAVTRAAAERLLEAGPPGAGDRSRARGLLVTALVELREVTEVAAGEWWQRALPEERIARAEQQGHRTLARLAGPVRDLAGIESAPGS
ncbi:FUSC family protein [Streptosporangium roseum]|uniref:FUSC family protein n=1 Tax=Streptosporangium roseum TaxID=2001 RepID=UPI0004CC9703|nr:FUSC family protein [Streptosporangium roseum]